MRIKPIRLLEDSIETDLIEKEYTKEDIICFYYDCDESFSKFVGIVSQINNELNDGMVIWSYNNIENNTYTVCVQIFEEFKNKGKEAIEDHNYGSSRKNINGSNQPDINSYTNKPN